MVATAVMAAPTATDQLASDTRLPKLAGELLTAVRDRLRVEATTTDNGLGLVWAQPGTRKRIALRAVVCPTSGLLVMNLVRQASAGPRNASRPLATWTFHPAQPVSGEAGDCHELSADSLREEFDIDLINSVLGDIVTLERICGQSTDQPRCIPAFVRVDEATGTDRRFGLNQCPIVTALPNYDYRLPDVIDDMVDMIGSYLVG